MLRIILIIAALSLAAPARAAIACYPADESALRTVYFGGTKAFAWAWLCGSTWSWVAMRSTGPDVRFTDTASMKAALDAIAALQTSLAGAGREEDGFVFEVLLPSPHN